MRPLIERFRDRLPVTASTPVVSLGEGSTPLLPAPRIGARLGIELYLKWEASNPTGSYKDRGMTVAVSKAVEEGAQAVVCASTGNTASSAAAYAARAGLPAMILQPEGAVASGKLAQTRMYGARVLEVRGSFDEALRASMELAARGAHALVNSVNPYRLEGQKTAVFEIVEELGARPDAVYLPYGGGGNTTAYGKGFAELGGAPSRIVAAEAVERPRTVASAIRIAEPVHAPSVADVIARSGGAVVSVSDEQIVEAWQELARVEGLFCEPSSAAGLAAMELERPAPGSTVVCVITGHGLKAPETASRRSPPAVSVDPDADAIAAAAAS
jgi:threonine synthase